MKKMNTPEISYGINSPSDLMERLRRDARILDAEATPDTIFNFTITSYHLLNDRRQQSQNKNISSKAKNEIHNKLNPKGGDNVFIVCRNIVIGSKHFKFKLFAFLSIWAIFLLQGCGIFYQPGSVPSKPVDGAWKLGRESFNEGGGNSIDVLYGEKINLGLRTYNQGKSAGVLLYPIPLLPMFNKKDLGDNYFAVTIGFRTQHEKVNINLKKLFLTLQDGSKIYPAGVIKRTWKQSKNLACVSHKTYRSYENEESIPEYKKIANTNYFHELPSVPCGSS